MVQKTVVYLTDDLTGAEADETVEFGLDGVAYTIDLTNGNAAALREALEEYVRGARRTGGGRGGAGVPRQNRGGGRFISEPKPFDEVDPRAVRAWAASAGKTVNKRGRIPASVIAEFREAGN